MSTASNSWPGLWMTTHNLGQTLMNRTTIYMHDIYKPKWLCQMQFFFFYRSCSNKFFYSQTVLSLTITCTASNNNVYCTILFWVSLYLFRLFSPLIFRTWNRALSTNMSHWLETTKHLDPLVWKVDKAFHWINLYPVAQEKITDSHFWKF